MLRIILGMSFKFRDNCLEKEYLAPMVNPACHAHGWSSDGLLMPHDQSVIANIMQRPSLSGASCPSIDCPAQSVRMWVFGRCQCGLPMWPAHVANIVLEGHAQLASFSPLCVGGPSDCVYCSAPTTSGLHGIQGQPEMNNSLNCLLPAWRALRR